MAEGARRVLKVDIAVSATGVAGPTGGTPETPVGTVFIGVSGPEGTRVEECHFGGDRAQVRAQSAAHALGMALEALEQLLRVKERVATLLTFDYEAVLEWTAGIAERALLRLRVLLDAGDVKDVHEDVHDDVHDSPHDCVHDALHMISHFHADIPYHDRDYPVPE